jgi:uncharacterized protein YyaL (SSP411 family)
MDLRLLLRAWRRQPREHDQRRAALLHVVTHTLDKMAAGGIYDHLGGGFHRYSTDPQWLVPHFEKMLYDNAQLIPCYLEAYLITGKADYARVAHETCRYVLREMTGAEGGFYSTQDADSEGEEGKFFVWTPDQIEQLLGPRAAQTFCAAYGVTRAGNFEHGTSVLNRPEAPERLAARLLRDPVELERELAQSRATLLAARENRIKPGLDDKVLVAWNGLMIDALAQAAGVLDTPEYLHAAQRAATFLLGQLRGADGRLLHTWRGGAAKLAAYLDDYACLANALMTLYEADFDDRWIGAALQLADRMLEQFADPVHGGFFFTANDHEQLITRQKDLYDNAVPSGNSMAVLALLRLGKLTGRADLLAAAERALRAGAAVMQQSPRAAGQLLIALDMYFGPTYEIVIIGDPAAPATHTVLGAVRHRFIPNKVLACRGGAAGPATAALDPLFAGKTGQPGEPTVYICENFACQAPRLGVAAALDTWDQLAAGC